jgi:hypothetical protein
VAPLIRTANRYMGGLFDGSLNVCSDGQRGAHWKLHLPYILRTLPQFGQQTPIHPIRRFVTNTRMPALCVVPIAVFGDVGFRVAAAAITAQMRGDTHFKPTVDAAGSTLPKPKRSNRRVEAKPLMVKRELRPP